MIQLEQIEGYRILRPNLRRSSESKNITTLHQIERKNERQESGRRKNQCRGVPNLFNGQ